MHTKRSWLSNSFTAVSVTAQVNLPTMLDWSILPSDVSSKHYIYIYIFICVCVCVCMCVGGICLSLFYTHKMKYLTHSHELLKTLLVVH